MVPFSHFVRILSYRLIEIATRDKPESRVENRAMNSSLHARGARKIGLTTHHHEHTYF